MGPVALSAAYTTPLYSQSDVAQIVRATTSTVQRWATGYTSAGSFHPPVLSGVVAGRGYTVPFVGMAEAFVLNAFRKAGLPLQRIRPAVDALKDGIGLEYALANNRLAHDGAEILYKSNDVDDQRLIVVRNGQAVFNEVVEDYLQHIDFSASGYAEVIRLPQFTNVAVSIRPTLNGGRPTVMKRGVAVEDILDRVRAGEPVGEVAEDFGLPHDDVMYLVRAAA